VLKGSLAAGEDGGYNQEMIGEGSFYGYEDYANARPKENSCVALERSTIVLFSQAAMERIGAKHAGGSAGRRFSSTGVERRMVPRQAAPKRRNPTQAQVLFCLVRAASA